ncbi:MAG: nitrogen regulatory protein P-II 1 [Clostridium sp.]|jgi:nitrogen regulatory protein P-II 1
MYAVFIILSDIDKLDDISKVFYENGSGATTLDSQGLGSVLFENNHDIPIFAGIRRLVEGSKPFNKTIISIIEGETKLRTIVDTISKEFTNKPGTGVMFVMPILECYGIKNVEYEKH